MPDPRTWDDLSVAQKREVEALAKQGKHHPSRVVARVAYDWASTAGGLGTDVAMGIGLVIDAALGNAGGAGQTLSVRRLAKRLVKIGPPDS